MNEAVVIRGEPSRLGQTADRSTAELCKAVGLNPGNLAFSYGSACILGFPRNKILTEAIHPPERIGVFTLANYLGKHYDPHDFEVFLRNAPEDWRLVAVGLGAQGPLDRLSSNPEDVEVERSHLSWLNAIKERGLGGTPNIGLRGQLTLDVLKQHGFESSAVVVGCPSHMISPNRSLGRTIRQKFDASGPNPLLDGVMGNPWTPSVRPFEWGIYRAAISSGGLIHVQMQEEHIALARGDLHDETKLAALSLQLVPEAIGNDDFKQYAKRHLRVWWDVPAWMEHFRRVDFVSGARIHGTILALQAGTPALCAVWDSRTLELCQTLNVPFVSMYDEPWQSGNFSSQDLRAAFAEQFDPQSFDATRVNLARSFTHLFDANEVPVSAHLKNLIN